MTLSTKFTAFTIKDIPESDIGIKVKEIISLLKGNKFESDLLESLEVESIKEEIISIPGAKTAISKLHGVDKVYKKIDHKTSCRRLEFDSSRKRKEEFADHV